MIITLHGRRQLLDRTWCKLCLCATHSLVGTKITLKITKQVVVVVALHTHHYTEPSCSVTGMIVKDGIRWELSLLRTNATKPNLKFSRL